MQHPGEHLAPLLVVEVIAELQHIERMLHPLPKGKLLIDGTHRLFIDRTKNRERQRGKVTRVELLLITGTKDSHVGQEHAEVGKFLVLNEVKLLVEHRQEAVIEEVPPLLGLVHGDALLLVEQQGKHHLVPRIGILIVASCQRQFLPYPLEPPGMASLRVVNQHHGTVHPVDDPHERQA